MIIRSSVQDIDLEGFRYVVIYFPASCPSFGQAEMTTSTFINARKSMKSFFSMTGGRKLMGTVSFCQL